MAALQFSKEDQGEDQQSYDKAPEKVEADGAEVFALFFGGHPDYFPFRFHANSK
jgi:hypothetical protein